MNVKNHSGTRQPRPQSHFGEHAATHPRHRARSSLPDLTKNRGDCANSTPQQLKLSTPRGTPKRLRRIGNQPRGDTQFLSLVLQTTLFGEVQPHLMPRLMQNPGNVQRHTRRAGGFHIVGEKKDSL